MGLDPSVQQAFSEQASTLTKHLLGEVEALEKLREVREQARLAKVEAAKDAAEASDKKLAQLLELQVQQEQARDSRRRFWLRIVVAPGGVLAVLAGIAAAYLQATKPPQPPKVEAVDVKRTVEERVQGLEVRQDVQIQRVKRLGDLHYEQAELILDQGDKLERKLDAIADRLKVRDEIEEPDTTVRAAREQVEAYKRLRERDVERSLKAGDPFADLPEMPAAFRTKDHPSSE